jgi:hypothetical protein
MDFKKPDKKSGPNRRQHQLTYRADCLTLVDIASFFGEGMAPRASRRDA